MKSWLSFINFIKLNGDKTELLLVGTTTTLAKLGSFSLIIDDSIVTRSQRVKSLGVILDTTLHFEAHINNITWSAYFHLRSTNRLCPLLHRTVLLFLYMLWSHLILTTVSGLPHKLLHTLQLVQNSATWIIKRTPSIVHTTPVLQQLHWLPVSISRLCFLLLRLFIT